MDNGDSKGANPHSTCQIAADRSVNHGYFFSGAGDFGWNIPVDYTGDFADLDPIESELIGSNGDDRVSARRSEGTSPIEEKMKVLAPKLTASGGSTVKTTSETPSKAKTKGPKQARQQRFAFVTKSEIDHLEDGYRWRKYGQKAVKNSPFPSLLLMGYGLPSAHLQSVGFTGFSHHPITNKKSYYRCTNSKCMVKKRVERSNEDPTVVITTYEGQHSHHSVGFPRGELIPLQYSSPNHINPSNSQFYNPRLLHYPQQNSLHITKSPQEKNDEEYRNYYVQEKGLETGEGLLGDIVSPGIRN